jgi:DNA-directed RNA polymerase subunit RPC12/RpoP
VSERIRAPWTPAQVAALNACQERRDLHPYTCGACPARDGLKQVLVAEPDGWRCPDCGGRQAWAHAASLNPPLPSQWKRPSPTPEPKSSDSLETE